MTAGELCRELSAEIHSAGGREREITGVTASDLLSFVMGTAQEGAAWVTIQTHLNVAAVAVLKDLPAIIIASGRKPAQDLIDRCVEENICVASVPDTIFGVCVKLARLGLNG